MRQRVRTDFEILQDWEKIIKYKNNFSFCKIDRSFQCSRFYSCILYIFFAYANTFSICYYWQLPTSYNKNNMIVKNIDKKKLFWHYHRKKRCCGMRKCLSWLLIFLLFIFFLVYIYNSPIYIIIFSFMS